MDPQVQPSLTPLSAWSHPGVVPIASPWLRYDWRHATAQHVPKQHVVRPDSLSRIHLKKKLVFFVPHQ